MRELLIGGFAALSAMVLVGGAEAHGPPRKKVEERVEINAFFAGMVALAVVFSS